MSILVFCLALMLHRVDGIKIDLLEMKLNGLETYLLQDILKLRESMNSTNADVRKIIEMLNNSSFLDSFKGLVDTPPIKADDTAETRGHSDISRSLNEVNYAMETNLARLKRAFADEKEIMRTTVTSLENSASGMLNTISTAQTKFESQVQILKDQVNEMIKNIETVFGDKLSGMNKAIVKYEDKTEESIDKFDVNLVNYDTRMNYTIKKVDDTFTTKMSDMKNVFVNNTIPKFDATLGHYVSVLMEIADKINVQMNVTIQDMQNAFDEKITSSYFEEKITPTVDLLKNGIKDNIALMNQTVNEMQTVVNDKLQAIEEKFESKQDAFETKMLAQTTEIQTALSRDLERLIEENVDALSERSFTYGNVRLANVMSYGYGIQGRLEVFHDNTWGTVCDDEFANYYTPAVVCAYFGFNTGLYESGAKYGVGKGPIWLDGVKCTGNEKTIFSCPHNAFGSNDCSHGEDVGIKCYE